MSARLNVKMSAKEWMAFCEALGYCRVEHARGFCMVKNGKKWIFNARALMQSLGVEEFADLAGYGYAVDDYLLFMDLSFNEFCKIVANMENGMPVDGDLFLGEGDFLTWFKETLDLNEG